MKTHFSAEGEIEFTALLYVPATRPFAKMGDEEEGRVNRVKLYVRQSSLNRSFTEIYRT